MTKKPASQPNHSTNGRAIAIGDIHGCARALRRLLEQIDPQPADTIVTLGDYIDRGSDSRGVIEQLLALRNRCRLVPLKGNHEEMMLLARSDSRRMLDWHINGGVHTLNSYDAVEWDDIPDTHWRFLDGCFDYFETDHALFVHANYDEEAALEDQHLEVILWRSLNTCCPGPHRSGKTAVVGHTIQPDVLDLGYLLALDTGCFLGGPLTACEIKTRQRWQAWEDD